MPTRTEVPDGLDTWDETRQRFAPGTLAHGVQCYTEIYQIREVLDAELGAMMGVLGDPLRAPNALVEAIRERQDRIRRLERRVREDIVPPTDVCKAQKITEKPAADLDKLLDEWEDAYVELLSIVDELREFAPPSDDEAEG